MNKRFTPLLFVVLISVVIADCNCKHVCTNSAPQIKFVNYDTASLNVIVVKQYNNNGAFNDLQHTTTYVRGISTGPDSLRLDTNVIYLEYFNDYVIQTPATGK